MSKFLYVALLSTWLNLEPSYLVVIQSYWGYPQRKNYASVYNILSYKCLRKFTFCTFSSFGIHAKDTKFINATHTTQRNIDTHRHMHTQTDKDTISTFYTFCLIWHICQIYKFYIWHATDLHMHRHSDMHTHGHTHVQRH